MQLALKYQSLAQYPVQAALISGKEPAIWLQTIDQWQVDMTQLESYLVPISKKNIEADGLLVIFKEAQTPAIIGNAKGYSWIANKLLVPVQAQLFPKVSDAELNALLLFDLQLFHPTKGLIGFNKIEQIHLGRFLSYPPAQEKEWDFAHSGNETTPVLQQITMPQPPREEILKNLQEGIGEKQLEDLPKAKDAADDSTIGKIVEDMKRSALKGGLSLSGKLLDAIGGPIASNNGKDGLLAQFENWANQQLNNLEEKRKQELERLMDLFETNPEEALKYAIPLEDKYKGRGVDTTNSNQLAPRSTDFNLGKLGGGSRMANWDAGNRFFDLRKKYLKAAQQQIEQKNFRKAAYIYAHLLHDFHSAANTLKQGGFYREAAALYIEHLKNKPAAAKCLEEGGLLFEAIELYLELDNKEKVGDLYIQLGELEKAKEQYFLCYSKAFRNKEYLNAARILHQKMKDISGAKSTLLTGWKESNQKEACLKQYFDLVKESEVEALAASVENIYQQHTLPFQQAAFLTVLLDLKREDWEDNIADISKYIAYEIISNQLKNGDTTQLNALNRFVSNDRLLVSDCNRFISKQPLPKLLPKRAYQLLKTIILDATIKWESSTTSHEQFLILGKKEGYLHLTRGNWEGHTENISWQTKLTDDKPFYFIKQPPAYTNFTFHSLGTRSLLKNAELPKNKHFFYSTKLAALNWLPPKTRAVAITSPSQIAVLVDNEKGGLLNFYDLEGKLLQTVSCLNKPLFLSSLNDKSNLFFRKGYFYLINQTDSLLRISEKGKLTSFFLNAKPQILIAPPPNTALPIAISTATGCFLFKTDLNELKQIGVKFSTDFIPTDMAFIPGSGLVLIKNKQVRLYDYRVIKNHKVITEAPTLIGQFEVAQTITAILPVSRRNQCAFLTTDGKVLVYNLKV